MLHWGAFLHDLGRVRVPDHILGEPGPLTREEWEVMKLHAVYGRRLLAGTYLEPAGLILEQRHQRRRIARWRTPTTP